MRTSERIRAGIEEVKKVLEEYYGGWPYPVALHRLRTVEYSMRVYDVSAAENASRIVACAVMLYSERKHWKHRDGIEGLRAEILSRHVWGMEVAAARRESTGD